MAGNILLRIRRGEEQKGHCEGDGRLILKSNITLIGMPGSGKSTVGVILAKYLSLGFIDTDVLIQINRQKSLQEIINESDYLNLRKVEEEEILKINIRDHVIATGGSAVYSLKAMAHLQDISTIVFLEVEFGEICKRIHNFETRGIAKAKSQTFRDLFNERQFLYRKYAELTIDGNKLSQEEIAGIIASKFRANN
ncbi:MAG: shikimate kinase [Nitrospirae bacterium]|nr:shikimate kinase [Nitrospirota bacterium]